MTIIGSVHWFFWSLKLCLFLCAEQSLFACFMCEAKYECAINMRRKLAMHIYRAFILCSAHK